MTGSAQGIGRGIAKCMSEEGAHIIVADHNRVKGEATASSIKNAQFIYCDTGNA